MKLHYISSGVSSVFSWFSEILIPKPQFKEGMVSNIPTGKINDKGDLINVSIVSLG